MKGDVRQNKKTDGRSDIIITTKIIQQYKNNKINNINQTQIKHTL